MNSSRFAVGCARCGSYDRDEVRRAVEKAVSLAGGFPEMPSRVLIKANLLSPSEPSMAVTTHPEVARAICGIISSRGVDDIEIADNPGYIFRHQEQELLHRTGMSDIQNEGVAKAGLLSRNGFIEIALQDAVSLKNVRVSSMVLDAPFVLDVPKLKTHVETEITGAIKNMFGISDTDTRKRAHGVKKHEFLLNAVIDLFLARVPDFCILDAVEGMEGNGPSHGKPVKAGWIAASGNALALDVVEASIMGYKNSFSIPLLEIASRRIPGPTSKEEIDLRGADWNDLPVKGFKRASGSIRMIPAFLRGMAHRFVTLSPRLAESACIGCGICRNVCPVDAISMSALNLPVIDTSRCVGCLCCHEMCPTGAMEVVESLLSRLMHKKSAP